MIVMNSNCFIEIYRIGGQIKSVGRTFDALLSTFRKIKKSLALVLAGSKGGIRINNPVLHVLVAFLFWNIYREFLFPY